MRKVICYLNRSGISELDLEISKPDSFKALHVRHSTIFRHRPKATTFRSGRGFPKITNLCCSISQCSWLRKSAACSCMHHLLSADATISNPQNNMSKTSEPEAGKAAAPSTLLEGPKHRAINSHPAREAVGGLALARHGGATAQAAERCLGPKGHRLLAAIDPRLNACPACPCT